MAILKVNNYRDVVEAVQTGHLIVWTGEGRIHEILNKAAEVARSQGLSPNILTRIKICKEIKFKKKAILKTVEGQTYTVETLSEILEKKEKLTTQDMVIIKSNELSEVLETVQQFINLGMFPDVYSEDELVKRKIVENFFNIRSQLEKEITKFEQSLDSLKLEVQKDSEIIKKEDLLRSIQRFKELAKAVEKNFKSTYDTTINTAIFATKKSGKSMIVNALLGEEYAPTSVELATPNIIVYEPHERKEITLYYKGKERTFETAKEIKSFIYQEFNKVNIEGKALPKMLIKYPKKEGINFKIYDTPGPDLFKSEHVQLLDEIIEDIDIAIFVVDYGKYAQTTEMELFEKIKKTFEKKKKNFSLICVINKIDLMFGDINVEKILVRAGDFIKEKLESFGYRNFIVIPVTAIMAFYALKLRQYYKDKEGIDIEKIDDIYFFLNEKLQEFRRSKKKEEELTTYVNELFRFSFYLEPNSKFKDLLELTGFETFKKYILYLSQNKAQLEKFWELIGKIEGVLTEMYNLSNSFSALLSEVERIKKEIEEFQRKIHERNFKGKVEEMFERNIKSEIKNYFKEIKDGLKKIEDNLKGKLENEYRRILQSLEEDMPKLKKGIINKDEFLKKCKEISFLSEDDFKKELKSFSELLEEIRKRINNHLEEANENLKRSLEEEKTKISQEVAKLSEKFRKNYKIDFNIKIPVINFEIPAEDLKNKMNKLSELGNLLQTPLEMEKFSEYIDENLLNKIVKDIISFLTLGFITLQSIEIYKIDEEKIKSIVHENYLSTKHQLEEINLSGQVYKELKLEELFLELEYKLNIVKENIKGQFDSIERVLQEILRDLNEEKRFREKKAKVLKSIFQELKPVFYMWNENISEKYKKIDKEVKNV